MLNKSTTMSLRRLAPARNAVLSWPGSKHGHRPDLATPNRLPPPRRGAAGAHPGGGSAVTAPAPPTRRPAASSPTAGPSRTGIILIARRSEAMSYRDDLKAELIQTDEQF